MSQIKKKGLEDDSVDGAKLRLLNNQTIRARNQAGDGDVDLFKLNASDDLEFVQLPVHSGSPIATQSYVSNAVVTAAEGILPKDPVQVATDAALPAATYDNGVSGVGATLTGSSNGAVPSHDGVTPQVGQRWLVQNQVNLFENGLYTLDQVGDGSNPFIFTRATDFDNSPSGEVRSGARTLVDTDTANDFNTAYVLKKPADDPVVIGTTDLEFTVYNAGAAGVSSVNGQTGVVSLDTDDINEGASNKYFTDQRARDALRSGTEELTLNGTDITNQYKDLAEAVINGSLEVKAFGVVQRQGIDYTLSVVSLVTRVTFAGDLATAGASELQSGDVLSVQYLY